MVRAVEEPAHTDDCVQPQQCNGDRRILQVHLPGLQRLHERPRQRGRIHLQPEFERRRGAQTSADTAVRGTRDRLVQLQGAAPKVLVAEIVEAKRVAAARDHQRRVLPHAAVVRSEPFVGGQSRHRRYRDDCRSANTERAPIHGAFLRLSQS